MSTNDLDSDVVNANAESAGVIAEIRREGARLKIIGPGEKAVIQFFNFNVGAQSTPVYIAGTDTDTLMNTGLFRIHCQRCGADLRHASTITATMCGYCRPREPSH